MLWEALIAGRARFHNPSDLAGPWKGPGAVRTQDKGGGSLQRCPLRKTYSVPSKARNSMTTKKMKRLRATRFS